MVKQTVSMRHNPHQLYDVEIEKGKSIRLTGIASCYREERPFDITFKIGDTAEYDSYNLTYVGKIISITEKTVTIEHGRYQVERSRLTLAEFAWRNFNFDAERIAKENQIESMCI
jgi:hypothetical protein